MIDSSMFALDIASGTAVTAGQEIPLKCVDGPAIVRSGRGAAILKRMQSLRIGTAGVGFIIKIKNSDWVDPVINECGTLDLTTMDRRTGGYQSGNNCPLTPNSSWEVVAVPLGSTTTTGAVSLLALIDIDYPSVSSIVDPETLPGIPCTITHEIAVTPGAAGGAETATWTGGSVDIFKAGYEYALQKCSAAAGSNGDIVFVQISNASGMGGLSRIIPVFVNPNTICNIIEYASKLVKGPMDIKIKAFGSSTSFLIIMDYVKRRI